MSRSFGQGLVVVGFVVACSSRAEEISADDSGSASTEGSSSDETHGETSGTGTIADGSASDGDAAAPACGNGVVEHGEQCDESTAGCVDCRFVCGFETPIPLDLSGLTVSTRLWRPEALHDGSGDVIVLSNDAVHRVTATGEEVWVRGGSVPSDAWPQGVTVTETDEIWVVWDVGAEEPVHTALTRHAAEGGHVLSTVELHGMPNRWGRAVHATGDGSVLVLTTSELGEATELPVLERRTDAGETVLWSSTITQEPDDDGERFTTVAHLAVADDGSLFVGAARKFNASHPLVVKLDDRGRELWQRTLFDDAPDDLVTASVDSPNALADGGIAFIAWQQHARSPAVIGAFHPPLETYAVRLDADGSTVWEIDPTDRIEGGGRVQLQAMHALEDGRFVVGGSLLRSNVADAWIGYLDADANLLCTATLPHVDGFDTMAYDVFLDAEGELVVSGFADEDDTPDTDVEVRFFARLQPY